MESGAIAELKFPHLVLELELAVAGMKNCLERKKIIFLLGVEGWRDKNFVGPAVIW